MRRGASLMVGLGISASLAAGCGGGDQGSAGPNAGRYSGQKRDIAVVVDALQSSARSGDADTICHQLFSDRLAGTIATRNSVPCTTQVRRKLLRDDASFRVGSITVRGNQAVAKVKDFTGATNGMYFVKQGGWKIDSIYSLAR